ncbi:MAG: hypothetical protein HY040_03625 [Planctomycetes bacterium]|nr:hypothetical protein [Planctomycetota bacterium]
MRRWRLLLAALLLAASGWTLYNALPEEPRWRLRLEGPHKWFEFCWQSDSQRVRLVAPNHELGAGPIVWRSLPKSILIDSNAGVIVHRSDAPTCGGKSVISADGRFVAGRLFDDCGIRCFDFQSEKLKSVKFTETPILQIGFSPSGIHLYVMLETAGRVTLEVFLTESLAPVFELDTNRTFETCRAPHFLPDGNRVMCLVGDHVAVWDLKTKEQLATFPCGDPAWPRVEPDGRKVYAYHKQHDPFVPRDIRKLNDQTCLLDSQEKMRDFGQISPDGRWWILSTPPDITRVYATQTGQQAHEWRGHGYLSRNRFFAPDGRHVAIAMPAIAMPAIALPADGDSQILRLFDLETGRAIWEHPIEGSPVPPELAHFVRLERLNPPRFSSDSRKMAVQRTARILDVLDVNSGELLAQIPRICESAVPARFTPDGRFLLDCGESHLQRGRPNWIKKLFESVFAKPKNSSERYFISVVDVQSRREVFRLDDSPGLSASLSPDGKSLIVANCSPFFDGSETDTPELTCWDIPARRPWRWILGIPLGLLVLVMSARWLLIRWQRRKAQVAAKTALSV